MPEEKLIMPTSDSAQQTMPDNVKELATLAMLASTAADERPSGETAEAHATRICKGLTQQLSDKTLATAGKWSLVWLARSPGNANVVFVTQNLQDNAIAVSLRGTLFSVLSDLTEDIDVGAVVALQVNDSAEPVGVSAGSMASFTEVMNAVSPSTSPQYANTNLMTVLQSLVKAAKSPPVIYVVGHSLGGAIATVVGLYLQGQKWGGAVPSFRVCTFAAPTAGVQSFAKAFEAAFCGTGPNSASRIVNTYDVVPQAWYNLPEVATWYPAPGPSAKDAGTDFLYTQIAPGLTNGQKYVQPCAQTPCNLKDGNPAYIPAPGGAFTNSTSQDWNAQVGYQHLSYLALLGAPLLQPGPFVTKIDVTSGPTSGGTTVTISGFNFTADDCAVDFGTVAAQSVYVSPFELKATTPAGFGIANVTVTNTLGTSAATPALAFAFGGPEPLAVTSINPEIGTKGQDVTINGSGLSKVTSVMFTFPAALLGQSPLPVEAKEGLVVTEKQIQVKAPTPPWGAALPPMNATVAVMIGDLYTQAGTFRYKS
jgi:pimeloyl-ACP methyl ester carboxylesterase